MPTPKKSNSSDVDLIRKLDRQWGADATAGKLDAVVDLYAKDGSLVWPDMPAIQGTRGIRTAWKEFIETPGLKIRFTTREIYVSGSGDLASDFGDVTIASTGQKPMTAKYLVVWQKLNGAWKVLYDSWNTNSAPPAPAAPTPPPAPAKAGRKPAKKK